MLWYVLERYVSILLGRTHLLAVGQDGHPEDADDAAPPSVSSAPPRSAPGTEDAGKEVAGGGEGIKEEDKKNGELKPPAKHVHLTQQELHGLKVSYRC